MSSQSVNSGIPGETDPITKPMTPRESSSLVNDLMNGDIEPASEFVSYLIEKMKKLAIEGVEVDSVIKQLADKQATAQQRMMTIRCEANAYQTDLVEWQRRGEIK